MDDKVSKEDLDGKIVDDVEELRIELNLGPRRYMEHLDRALDRQQVKKRRNSQDRLVIMEKSEALPTQNDARQELGTQLGIIKPPQAQEIKGNLTIKVVQFKREDCKKNNADTE